MSHQPICFESLQVSDKSAKCNKCPMRTKCADGAYALLDAWAGHAAVDADRLRIALISKAFQSPAQAIAIEGAKPVSPPAPPKPNAVPATPKPKPSAGNKAVKRACARSETKGTFAMYARELSLGRNPAKKTWEVLFFELLLNGGMTQSGLAKAYMSDERTRYTAGTARTRACTAIAMFQEALLIRKTENGQIVIHPSVKTDNLQITKAYQP